MEAAIIQEAVIEEYGDGCAGLSCEFLPVQNQEEECSEADVRLSANRKEWKARARQLQHEVYIAYLVFRHPRMPWHSKLVAAFAVGYVLSPIQLIPSFIPVIGFLDDILVLVFAIKLIHKITPPTVLAECRARAESTGSDVVSEGQKTVVIVVAALVALVWILFALGVTALALAYL